MTAMHSSMLGVRSWHHDATHVIALAGELNHVESTDIIEQVTARLAGLGAEERVAFDLGEVTACSPAGLRCILGLIDLAERSEIAVLISDASQPVRQAFDLAGIAQLLPPEPLADRRPSNRA